MKMDKKREEESVKNRRLDNLREISELKASLQRLINEGLHSTVSNPKTSVSVPVEKKILPRSNQQTVAAANTVKTISKPKEVKTNDSPPKKEAPKNRGYNVEETREYMRKQKEKRVELSKSNVKQTNVQADLKKQKLQELHKKTRELVAKNVELKRERSKSREPQNTFLRPDYTSGVKSRSVSRENDKTSQKNTHRSISQGRQNLLRPNGVKSRSVSRERGASTERGHIIKNQLSNNKATTERLSRPTQRNTQNYKSASTNMLRPNGVKSRSVSRERGASTERGHIIKNQLSNNKATTERLSRPTQRNTQNYKSASTNNLTDKNKLTVPKVEDRPSRPPNLVFANTNTSDIQNVSHINILSNITLRGSENTSQIDLNGSSDKQTNNQSKEQNFNLSPPVSNFEEYVLEKQLKKSLEQKQQSKETQTFEDQKKNYPEWLNEQPAKVDPYNFINTVKRKLQNALTTPHYIDIGTQSSLKEDGLSLGLPQANLEPTSNLIKPRKLAFPEKSSPISPDLKSFISHRCLNLDPKPVEHLGLQLQNHTLLNNKHSKKRTIQDKTTTITDSDSDTSKNIPDISSESGTSLRKNAESVRLSDRKINDFNLQINTKNLNNMKLSSKTNLDSSLDTIQSDIEKFTLSIDPKTESNIKTRRSKSSVQLFGTKGSYTSDYNTESDFGSSIQENSVKSSEVSIIAGNVCSYGAQGKAIKSNHSNENQNIPEEISDKSDRSKSKRSSKNITEKISVDSSIQFQSIPALESSSKTRGTLSFGKTGSSHSAQNTSQLITNKKGDSLQEPQVSLKIKKSSLIDGDKAKSLVIQSDLGNLEKPNQIHLKFEAEIHLLNDFNKSIHQFSAVEKAFESLKSKNDISQVLNSDKNFTLSIQDQDVFKVPASAPLGGAKNDISQVNFSRGGSDISTISNYSRQIADKSLISGLEMTNGSSFSDTIDDSNLNVSLSDNYDFTNPAGMYLVSIEQSIKDEDARYKNLKMMLKIREKSLRDRVVARLSELEVQRRALCDTGKLQEASVVKKKQRGILLKHSEEKHEIQRLKQLQETKSKERISKLQEKRKLIKDQLSTDKMLSKIKVNTPRDRKLHGPLRVLSHSESIVSETSISRKSSIGEDVVSVSSSKHSVTSVLSDVESNLDMKKQKRALLMREAALEKRKKEAEGLLQWHRRLVESEKRINELENAANAVTSQSPKVNKKSDETKYEFKGALLNQIWYNITGFKSKKFVENKIYVMSDLALKKFCKNARDYFERHKSAKAKVVYDGDNSSVSKVEVHLSDLVTESIPSTDSVSQSLSSEIEKSVISTVQDKEVVAEGSDVVDKQVSSAYTSDFDLESIKEMASVKTSVVPDETISSISNLIDNFSKIDEEMNVMSRSHMLLEESNKLLSEVEDSEFIEKHSLESTISEQKFIIPEEVVEQQSSKTIFEEIPQIIKVEKSETETKISEELGKTDNNDKTIITEEVETQQSQEASKIKEYNVVEEKEQDSLSEVSQSTLATEKEISTDSSESSAKTDVATEQEKTDIKSEKLEQNETSKETSIKTKTSSDTTPPASIKEDTVKSSLESEDQKQSEQQLISEDEQPAISDKEITEILSESTEEKSPSKSSQVQTASDESSPKTPEKKRIDVKKRVSEILADANHHSPRGDKSPRMQDLYVTTYDVPSPSQSPDLCSPIEEELSSLTPPKNLGSEAEELLRKQLAIEQEIKQLEQQQKELPYVFMREIPNKPPPPYTPPSSNAIVPVKTVMPTSIEEIEEISKYSAKIIHKAYVNNNLENISISENTLSLITKNNISKDCYKYVFDICKEIAQNHYKQFEKETGPTWLRVSKKPLLAPVKPLDLNGLEKLMNTKLKELFNFKKPDIRENMIIKWSRKKRDHVDEILVLESQAEEAEWTYYDKDEKIVMDKVTNEIMNVLLVDTANVLNKLFFKKTQMY